MPSRYHLVYTWFTHVGLVELVELKLGVCLPASCDVENPFVRQLSMGYLYRALFSEPNLQFQLSATTIHRYFFEYWILTALFTIFCIYLASMFIPKCLCVKHSLVDAVSIPANVRAIFLRPPNTSAVADYMRIATTIILISLHATEGSPWAGYQHLYDHSRWFLAVRSFPLVNQVFVLLGCFLMSERYAGSPNHSSLDIKGCVAAVCRKLARQTPLFLFWAYVFVHSSDLPRDFHEEFGSFGTRWSHKSSQCTANFWYYGSVVPNAFYILFGLSDADRENPCFNLWVFVIELICALVCLVLLLIRNYSKLFCYVVAAVGLVVDCQRARESFVHYFTGIVFLHILTVDFTKAFVEVHCRWFSNRAFLFVCAWCLMASTWLLDLCIYKSQGHPDLEFCSALAESSWKEFYQADEVAHIVRVLYQLPMVLGVQLFLTSGHLISNSNGEAKVDEQVVETRPCLTWTLGRLCFGANIAHCFLQFYVVAHLRVLHTMRFSWFSLCSEVAGLFFGSMIISFVTTVLLQMPVANFSNMVINRVFKSRRASNKNDGEAIAGEISQGVAAGKRSNAAVIFVEEKFGEQNFRVLSEMRILAKIRVAILDFCRV